MKHITQWNCQLLTCVWFFVTPPGSTVHGIIQARVLEWVAIHFSRGASWPRDRTRVSCIAGRFFNVRATNKGRFLSSDGLGLLLDEWPFILISRHLNLSISQNPGGSHFQFSLLSCTFIQFLVLGYAYFIFICAVSSYFVTVICFERFGGWSS